MANRGHSPSDWPPKIVACAGAVVLQGGRALLVRQAPGHPLAGQWSIPWGIIEPDEPPEVAAVRETREESGVVAEVEGLLGIQNLNQPGWIAIIFLCRHTGGIPVPDGGIETDQAAYFTLEEMVALDELLEPWCEWLVRRVLLGECRIIPPVSDNPYQPRLAFF